MYATGSATTQATTRAASQSTAPASTRRASHEARQQPATSNAAGSIAQPTVRGNPQVVAPSTPQPDQPKTPESADRIAYRIQMLDFYKSEVVDPLCAFAEQRQQIPDQLRRQLETMVQEFNTVRQNLNAKLSRTTLATGQVDTLRISRSMAMTDQLKALARASDRLSSLDIQLDHAQKVGRLTKTPVEKAKAYRNDLQAVGDKIFRNLESQVNLTQVDEGAEQAQDAIDNQTLLAQIKSQPLLECLTSDTPVDPGVLQQFNDIYQELCVKTLGDARSSTTLKGLENYFQQGLSALAGTAAASQLNPLNDSLVQIKCIYAITVSLTNLIPKDLPIENAVPKITKLKKDLTRCTNHSQQLQELFVKHPNVHVRKIAPLGAAAEVVQPPSTGQAEPEKDHPKVTVLPNLEQTALCKELVFKTAEVGCLDTLYGLLAQGVSPYVRNDEGNSLLHIALRKGHIELATFLIQVQGLPADFKGADGLSVLEQAIKNDEPLVIAGLLHAIGQDQMLGGNSTPAILTKANALGQTPLQQVIQHNAVRVLEDWTNNFGFKLDDLQVQNQPVLDYVAKNGSQEMLTSVVPLLLPEAPRNATKAKFFTLACECVEMGKPEAGKYLVRAFGVDLEKPGQYDRTLFQYAVIANNLQEMRMLKALGANIHATDDQSNNAFHLAACFANTQTLQVLNSEFGFTDLEAKGLVGQTAFLQATVHGNLANMRALKEMGAQVNAFNNYHSNAFHLAAIRDDPEMLLFLHHECGPIKLEEGDFWGETAFLLAAKEGNIASMRALKEMGARVNAVDCIKQNAFHLAAMYANPETLRVLRDELGFIDMEVKAHAGLTAFYLAAEKGNVTNMRALMEMGAQVNAVNESGDHVWYLAAIRDDPEMLLFLHHECGFKSLEERDHYGQTAFLAAALRGKVANMRALKGIGADVNARQRYSGENAFDRAAMYLNPETLQVLRSEFGFTDLEAKGRHGRTAFLLAARQGKTVNLRALKEMGANIHAKDEDGDTALDLARVFSTESEPFKYLQSLGIKSGR